MQSTTTDCDALIEIKSVHESVPWWPYSSHGTYRLMRLGRLGHVRIGHRRFVTRSLLSACIAAHTQVQP